MNYVTIKHLDIANGPGIRVSLFVSGCSRKCKGCFNQEAQDFTYGQEFTWETLHELERLVNDPNVSGLSILGGDPLEPENRQWVETLCAYIHHNCPEKTIWLWTGDLWENVKDLALIQHVDILVDGPFVEDLKDLRLKWKGSSNQRIINVTESLKTGEVVEYDM